MTRQSATYNLIQDSVLGTLLFVIAVIVPVSIYLHVPPNSGEGWRLGRTVIICGSFMPFFCYAYMWVIKTNEGHLEREIEARISDPGKRDDIQQTIDSERGIWARNLTLLRAARTAANDFMPSRFFLVLSAHLKNQNIIAQGMLARSLIPLFFLMYTKGPLAPEYLRGRTISKLTRSPK
jgi:hypothetical protein